MGNSRMKSTRVPRARLFPACSILNLIPMLVFGLSACSIDSSALLPGADAGGGDATRTDSGSADSGRADTLPADSGGADTAVRDSGVLDTGPVDAGCDPAACPGRRCETGVCAHYESCQTLHIVQPTLPSGVYRVLPSGAPDAFDAYCEMREAGGGWTLVLKTDGTTGRFDYADGLWTDGGLHNEGSLDLSPGDAKLEAYLYVGFEDLRVGLQPSGGTLRWLDLRREDGAIASMRDAMMQGGTPGVVRPGGVAPSYEDWTGILPGSDSELQRGCGRSAMPNPGGGGCFRICARVRIGILGNDFSSCNTPDTYLGLGGHPSDDADAAPTGSGRNGRARPAFGFVLVR